MRYVLCIVLIVAALWLHRQGSEWRGYAESIPVYSTSDAVERAYREAGKDGGNSEVWYRTLSRYVTPYKMFYNLGTGSEGLALGLWIAVIYVAFYPFIWMRRRVVVCTLWAGLWLVRIPFTYEYYLVRQWRHDFPSWSDSIGLPIMMESLSWGIGAFVTTALLAVWMKRYPLAKKPQLRPSLGRSEWPPFVILVVWIVFLLCTLWKVPRTGDVGGGVALPGAIAILVSLLLATRKQPVENLSNDVETVAELPIPADNQA